MAKTGEDLKQEWWAFHKQNPHVFDLLVKFTFDVIKRGYTNYSVNALFERIRWHTEIETGSGEFKLSNNHRAYYARLFHHYYPDHAGFFRTKPTRSEKEQAYDQASARRSECDNGQQAVGLRSNTATNGDAGTSYQLHSRASQDEDQDIYA